MQTRAAAGHTDIQAYSAGFKVIGCTETVDAIDNTGTTGTGVPIYWLDGDKVADDYADFYDGSWDSSSPTTETGASVTTTSTDGVITGCAVPGTGGGLELGLGISASMGNPSGTNDTLSGFITRLEFTHRLYGLSVVFEVRASTDATLSALVVNDGTNDRTLDPTFVPGTFDYDADVGNAVTTVTLTATVNNSSASVTGVTLGGTAIADTDFSDGITVPSLAEDDNEIVVTVTPESGATKDLHDHGDARAAENDHAHPARRGRGSQRLEPDSDRAGRGRQVPAAVPLLDEHRRHVVRHRGLQHLRPGPRRRRAHRHPGLQLGLQGGRLHLRFGRHRQHRHRLQQRRHRAYPSTGSTETRSPTTTRTSTTAAGTTRPTTRMNSATTGPIPARPPTSP